MARVTEDTRSALMAALKAIKADRDKGVSWAKTRSAHLVKGEKVNYSQAWLYVTHQSLPKEQRITGSESEVAAKIVAARDKEQQSWGLIAVRCSSPATEFPTYPEAKVRRVYRSTAKAESVGTRIGHGGRFLYGKEFAEALYGDVLKESGTRLELGELERIMKDKDAPLERRRAAAVIAQRQRLNLKEVAELRTLADERGIKHAGLSKPRLITELVRATQRAMAAQPTLAEEVKVAQKDEEQANA